MKFERLTDNGQLWAVVFDGESKNALDRVFEEWNDYQWLRDFFKRHYADLSSYFHIVDIDRASEMTLGRTKAKGRNSAHSSWLRLYAIRLESGRYIITGGAIKLTATMKNTDKELAVLQKHETTTNWRQIAEWRRDNSHWLRYSGFIALAVLNRLETLGISQKQLAEKMNCTPQYVSKLLKGTENLTLDTISRLEECLDLDLIRKALS